MNVSPTQLRSESLELERRSLIASARLHWFHWLIIGGSLVLTLSAWHFSRSQIEQRVWAQFDRETRQVVSQVEERMRKYEDALWAGVSMIQTHNGDVGLPAWQTFSENLQIEEKYPGINGIGVIHHLHLDEREEFVARQRTLRPQFDIHPSHAETQLLPITYIEPETSNAAAVGLDMAHETNRRTGIMKARDTGLARITGPIVLVQDEGRTPGFLFFAPWYRENELPENQANRRRGFIGAVYAPFVVKSLMQGALSEEERHVGIRISDGDHVLFDEHNTEVEDFDPDPMYQVQVPAEIYGREWLFDVWSAKSFRAAASNSQPWVILFGGIFIDILLFVIFVALSRANRRALRFAESVASELESNATRLARSNAELEKFAYVASHDLKTPLRGMTDLTEYLEEDLESYFKSPEANPDVKNHLERMHNQVIKMNNLINGILHYSRIDGDGAGTAKKLNPRSLIEGLRLDLALRDDQLTLQAPQTVMVPAAVYFEQIVTNLIANAVNHHHEPENARIQVQMVRRPNRLEVSVTDNGPGIDPRYQERIFGVFETLQTDQAGRHTGIGLSIVKKILDNRGGQIQVDSAVGRGSTFSFEWPVLSQSSGDAHLDDGDQLKKGAERWITS